MNEEIRLCLIGAGSHSSRSIHPYLHCLEGAQVVANCDLDVEKARRLAARFGIDASYEDFRRMLDEQQPDGVIVCVSGDFHSRAAVEIMQRGCHVYTEKPPAQTLAAARRVVETKRRTGRVCMTGYKKRFAPAYVRAKAVIDGEGFGDPALLTLLRTKGPGEANYLLRWGCHATDLLPFLFGPVRDVCTFRTPQATHAYAVDVHFANGAVGSLCVTDRPDNALEEVAAFGVGGMTVRVQNSILMQAYRGDQPVAEHRPSFTQTCMGHVEQGFVGELQEFVAAIREGREPESGIESAAHGTAIYEAIERSAETGRTEEVEAI